MAIQTELHPQYITTEDGTKTSVVLSIEEYESLLEDLEDLAAVAARLEEPCVSHETLLSDLKQDGIL